MRGDNNFINFILNETMDGVSLFIASIKLIIWELEIRIDADFEWLRNKDIFGFDTHEK